MLQNSKLQLPKYSFFTLLQTYLKENLNISEINLRVNVNFNERGDFTLPLFEVSKKYNKDSAILARDIQEFFKDKKYVSTFYKDGFLDFYLQPSLIIQNDECEEFLYKNNSPAKIVIEFSSPNIAKPFTIGHLRSTNIGNALSNIFEYTGDSVIRLNYLGDWGTQFGKLLYAYKNYSDLQKVLDLYTLNALYIRFHSEEEKNKALGILAQDIFKQMEKGDKELHELWKKFYTISMEYLDDIYKKLNVKFDDIERESCYIQKSKVLTQELLQKGIAKVSQDAIVADLASKNLGVAILQKKDESTIYFSRDLAALLSRFEKYKFDYIFYIVGKEQQLHFKQLFTIAQEINSLLKNRLIHIPFGHFRFKGEKISTREGKIIYFDEVLKKGIEKVRSIVCNNTPSKMQYDDEKAQKIALSALKYYDLKNRIIKDIDFSWDEALQFDGNTGPYILYALVRIKGLLKNFTTKFGKEPNLSSIDLKKIVQYKQIDYLLRKIYLYNDFILLAKTARELNILCNYIFDLLKIFSNFYQTVKIITEDEQESKNNLYPLLLLQQVIQTYIRLLGLEEIEAM